MKILNSFRRLIALFPSRIWLAIAFSVVSAVFLFPTSFLIRQIFDRAIPQSDYRLLLKISLAVVALFSVNAILVVRTRIAILSITREVMSAFRKKLIENLLNASHAYYQRAGVSSIHKTLIHDTEKLDNYANVFFSVVLPSIMVNIFLFVILILISWQMSLLLLVVIPFIFIITGLLRRSAERALLRFQGAFEKFHQRTLFVLEMNKLIKISSARDKEVRVSSEIISNLRDSGLKMAAGYIRIANYQDLIFSLSSILLLMAGSFKVMSGDMSLGTLISFYFCLYLLKRYATSISIAIPSVIEGMNSLDRCISLLHESESHPELYSGTSRAHFDGSVKCVDVDFSYENKKVLKSITVNFNPGEVTLVLGPNGVGKTTLANLLMGLYLPQAGHLIAGGLPYSEWDIRYLRSKMSVVSQDDTTFQGSLLENILYPDTPYDREAVDKVLQLCDLTNFVASLPDGLLSITGDKGVMLSGGQRQKLAIARCFLSKAPFIILDEPTNHLDQQAIAKLAVALKTQAHLPAIVIISHATELMTIADRSIHLNQQH